MIPSTLDLLYACIKDGKNININIEQTLYDMVELITETQSAEIILDELETYNSFGKEE